MNKKVVVVSGVNFFEGGPLTVMRDVLRSAVADLKSDYIIYALVHDSSLYDVEGVEYIEFPSSRKSWFHRIYFEFIHFFFLSLKLRPFVWLSMHDITPNVLARHKFVYCHNPSPFYKATLFDFKFDRKFYLFSKFYWLLYRISINQNKLVFVQQTWLKDQFSKFVSADKIAVARPDVEILYTQQNANRDKRDGCVKFFYPALARTFKNHKVLIEAFVALPMDLRINAELILTLSGDENQYAKMLYDRYCNEIGVKFVGRLNKQQMHDLYSRSSALVFPSKLETWGLPITEAKQYGLPILASDLPYAIETVGRYDGVVFINPDAVDFWSEIMCSVVRGAPITGSQAAFKGEDVLEGWSAFWQRILKELGT